MTQIIAATFAPSITLIVFFLTRLYDRKKDREARYREYLQTKAQPFLMALNKALNEIYRTPYFPPYYRKLYFVLPEIKIHAKRDEQALIDAMVEMSSQRIELLLCIKQTKIVYVAHLFANFMQAIVKLRELRDEVWHNPQKESELINKQEECEDLGRDLLLKIRDSFLNFKNNKDDYSLEKLNNLSDVLREPFRKSSAFIATFASAPQNYFWIGIWQSIFTKKDSDNMLNYFQSIYYEISQIGYPIPDKFPPKNGANEAVYMPYFIIKFTSKNSLENFLNKNLPEIKLKNPEHWLTNSKPLEIHNLES